MGTYVSTCVHKCRFYLIMIVGSGVCTRMCRLSIKRKCLLPCGALEGVSVRSFFCMVGSLCGFFTLPSNFRVVCWSTGCALVVLGKELVCGSIYCNNNSSSSK